MDILEWHQLARSGLSECLPPLMTLCLRAERMPRPSSPLCYTVTQRRASGLPALPPLQKTACYGFQCSMERMVMHQCTRALNIEGLIPLLSARSCSFCFLNQFSQVKSHFC